MAYNKPGERKHLDSIKVSGKVPGSFFTGSESYIPITIYSINIKTNGRDWISELNIPYVPYDI